MFQPPTGEPSFRLGRRRIVTQDHTGQPRYAEIPLSVQDYLDPLPDDDFELGERHARAIRRMASILRTHTRYNPAVTVLTRTKVRWDAPLASHPAPDILLLNNLSEPSRPRPILDLAQEQVTVRAVIEIVAPLFAAQDLHDLPALYAAAGVPELWLIDCGLRPSTPQVRYTIQGFVLRDGVYAPIVPDDTGRLVSERGRFFLAVTPDAQDFMVGDTRSGQTIVPAADLDYPTSARVEATLRAESIAAKLDFLR